MTDCGASTLFIWLPASGCWRTIKDGGQSGGGLLLKRSLYVYMYGLFDTMINLLAFPLTLQDSSTFLKRYVPSPK